MEEQTELLRKILEMLTLMAEPQIAQRDQKLRAALAEVVGKGQLKARAVSLMDGTRAQSAICKESGIDAGGLSRLTKALREKGLIGAEDKLPKLAFPLPPGFWTEFEGQNAG
jgi:hypothetical protein